MNKLYLKLIKLGYTDAKSAEKALEHYKRTGKLPVRLK